MGMFSGKNILIGVTGGIAAYKTAELVRQLTLQQASVRVVMTESAKLFASPLTFQALSDNSVHSGLLDISEEASMGHIRLARWADFIVIAPATADFLAKMRLGVANDLLSALCLAAEVPIVVAPAMNRAMWINPATQENIGILSQRGITLLGPDKGIQACGEEGYGRMMEPLAIGSELTRLFCRRLLQGVSVLVSAGPTQEAIDPVRYISNRSSGKMGYAVAQAAVEQGALVTLVSGPVNLIEPRVDAIVHVQSASNMFDAIMEKAPSQALYIGAAAVADYEPVNSVNSKIKKNPDCINLQLRKTRDILSSVAALDNAPFTCGFAAETDNLESYARQKLENKGIDMVAANWVGGCDGGFDSDHNALHVFWSDGQQKLEFGPKLEVARGLLEIIADKFNNSNKVPVK